MAHLQSSNEIDDLIRRYSAHDSQLKGHSLELLDILGQSLCLNSSLVHGFQMRAHHLAQLGEMRQVPLAVEKWPTKLAFELLYRTRERRLRHAALFRRAREVQFLCHPEEIPNLMHFHDNLTGMVDRSRESVGIGSYSPGRRARVLGILGKSARPIPSCRRPAEFAVVAAAVWLAVRGQTTALWRPRT